MALRFRARKTVRLGPVRLNFTQSGFSSWGLGVGRWSWNSRTGQQRFDTPGPGGLVWGGRGAAQRRAERRDAAGGSR
jgi:hypothetical protein